MKRSRAFWGAITIGFLACAAHATAQTITVSNVQNTLNGYFPKYVYTQNGYTPGAMYYYNFTFDVSAGTGAGSSLAGGNYMGFCVNAFFPDPVNGTSYDLDSTGSVLSYSVNGSADYWDTDTNVKYAALQDVLSVYAYQLATNPKGTQQYADMVTAFSILSTELALDYNGTLASIDTDSGNNTVKDMLGNPISGNVATLYNSMRSTVGTGAGAGFNLYAAGYAASTRQDLVFFNVNAVPEPSAPLMLAAGGGLCLMFRKRRGA